MYEINPIYCVSICSYNLQCGLKYIDINLQTLQDKDMILLMEKIFRGGISSILGDMFFEMKIKRSCIKMLLIYMATQ